MRDESGNTISLASLRDALSIQSVDGTKSLANLDDMKESIQQISVSASNVESVLTSNLPLNGQPRQWYDLDAIRQVTVDELVKLDKAYDSLRYESDNNILTQFSGTKAFAQL
jgi:hypothetical protein